MPIMDQEIMLRAIPDRLHGWLLPGEQWVSTKGLTWEQKGQVVEELQARGYFVQEIWPLDPKQLLVEARVRKEIDEEAKK